jgi:hypothetical protein
MKIIGTHAPSPKANYKTSMAPINTLMVEEIINGFPTHVLPKIDNKLTFEDIQATTHMLNENAI